MKLTKQQKIIIISVLSLVIVGLLVYLFVFRNDDDNSGGCQPPKVECDDESCAEPGDCPEDVKTNDDDDGSTGDDDVTAPQCPDCSFTSPCPSVKSYEYEEFGTFGTSGTQIKMCDKNDDNLENTRNFCNYSDECGAFHCNITTNLCQAFKKDSYNMSPMAFDFRSYRKKNPTN